MFLSKRRVSYSVFRGVIVLLTPWILGRYNDGYDDDDDCKQVNGSLLPAFVISVYYAYVCYTGLSCKPQDYACNGLHNKSAVSTSTLVLGMLTTVLSVLYSTLHARSSTTFLSPLSSPKS
ncbi:hypothetical protein U1Q18_025452, partial [Sarracenia purpurea var. burkii]